MSDSNGTCPVHDEAFRRIDENLNSVNESLKEIWPRLRGIELRIAWGGGIIAAILFVFQVMPYLLKVLKWIETVK